MFLTSNMVPTGGNTKVTTSIANKFTVATTSSVALSPDNAAIESLSGALTAGVLKEMVNITGTSGKIPMCAVIAKDGTARTVRLQITLDSSYVINLVSNSITTPQAGVIACGSVTSGGALSDGEPLSFKTSCKIEIASSLTETDKISLLYKRMSEA